MGDLERGNRKNGRKVLNGCKGKIIKKGARGFETIRQKDRQLST